MDTPNERPAEKFWKELSPQQVEHFFKLGEARAERFGEFAKNTLSDLAKYLFAANAGAAAGIFILLRSTPMPVGSLYLWTFYIFCAGTFFVGVAHLALYGWACELGEGWANDMNAWGRNEITISAVDKNDSARFRSCKRKWAHVGIWISFALLMVGGVIAAISLWLERTP